MKGIPILSYEVEASQQGTETVYKVGMQLKNIYRQKNEFIQHMQNITGSYVYKVKIIVLKTRIDVAEILLYLSFDIKCTESQALILHGMDTCVNVTLFFSIQDKSENSKIMERDTKKCKVGRA